MNGINNEFNGLVADFKEQSDKAGDCLEKLGRVITGGGAPSPEMVAELNTYIAGLDEKYGAVYSMAASMVPEEELPPYGSPAAEVADAVRNSRSRFIAEQTKRTRSVLERFAAICSKADEYAALLAPYQSAASELLDRITEKNIEELLPQAQAPELFIQAMAFENINSREGFMLMEQLRQYYPESELRYGLISGQYSFGEYPAEKAAPSANAAGANKRKNKSFKPEASSGAVMKTRAAGKTGAVSGDAGSAAPDLRAECPGEEAAKPIEKYPVVNSVKTSNPSASAFKKEIISLEKRAKEVTAVLPLLTNLGVLTKEQIYEFGIYTNCFDRSSDAMESTYAAVDLLVSKGLLARIDIGTDEFCCCLSDYCFACMKKESIATQKGNFWQVSYGSVKVTADKDIDKSVVSMFVRENDFLLLYLSAQKNSLSEKQFRTVMGSIKWADGYYRVAVYDDKDNLCLAALAPSINDLGSTNEEYIIVSGDTPRREISLADTCVKVFTVKDGKVSCPPSGDAPADAAGIGRTPADRTSAGRTPAGKKGKARAGEKTGSSMPDNETKEEPATEMIHESPVPDKKTEEAPGTPEALSARALLALDRTPYDEEFLGLINELLERKSGDEDPAPAIVSAVLLAKGAGLAPGCPKCKKLSAQLRLAANLLTDECVYSSECLSEVFSDPETDPPALALAAYMQAMLTPAAAYDYGLQTRTGNYMEKYDTFFGELMPFKPLFNKLLGVKKVREGGFTPAVIALLGNEDESERFIGDLRGRAKENLTVVMPKTRMKALPVMYNNEFGPGSDLHSCMEMIADGRTDGESLEWVETVLSGFVEESGGVFTISGSKIEERLNKAWSDANPKNKFKLEYDARDKAVRQYRQRIDIMVVWAEHVRNRTGNKQDLERLRSLKGDILKSVAELREDNSWHGVRYANVLSRMLEHIKNYLNDEESYLSVYSDILYTGVFSMSESGVPELESMTANIKYYELWRNALRHIASPRKTAEEIISGIYGESSDNGDGLRDNLRQLVMLGRLIDRKNETYAEYKLQTTEVAKKYADELKKEFLDGLELAYTYYQINETEKDSLAGITRRYENWFYEIGDFACWRRFLEALKRRKDDFAESRKKELRARLAGKLREDKESRLLLEAERFLEEDSNFAVTEEYLNRYEAGVTETDSAAFTDNDYFSDFLSDDVFEPLKRECDMNKGRALKSFGWSYLERKLPKDWTSRLRESSRKLVSDWPVRKDTLSPEQVLALLRGLGIDAISAAKENYRKEEVWQVSVKPAARNLADYLHPIAAFGTQMKSPMQIIFLYGTYTGQQLVDTITSMNLGTISIVFIDRPIDAASRRLIGEIFHTQKTGQNPFLLVDQILFLYLAMHQETERLPAMLKCTLPYTAYQPFVRDGGSTADEMFCGRTRELATIIDPNGACVVYGGRQLGKTALLERAESRCSKPENNKFAVYSTIIRHTTEAEVAETLINDINRKTDGKITITPCKTLREMCAQISDMFRNGSIVSMHLFIDEVDDFLGAVANDAYRPLQPLVDLKRETKNNFKFVITGLHNVCRAKNATADNGVFGQLGTPLCIKPLSPADAMRLISRPLSYLGFQVDRSRNLETILTKTNYYPGILQFFAYILVETLTGQYSKYYRANAGNPPYTLQDNQLGDIINSSDMNKSIKDKFRWSLELDPRYFMIARCIAMLYLIFDDDNDQNGGKASGSWEGFSVDEIINTAQDYDIHCLADVSKSEYTVLMDEMVEMGILGKPDKNADRYRLRRDSFVDIIGKSLDSLEADIINNNKEDDQLCLI